MIYPIRAIRLLTEHTETFVLEVMANKRHGFAAGCARGPLWILSRLFIAIVKVRQTYRKQR